MRGVPEYRPMSVADLGAHLASHVARDQGEPWRMAAELLEEHRHEPRANRLALLADEPAPTGDERWDTFLAALAEHLAAIDDRRGPRWCETRSLDRFWFPFNTPAARVKAIVHAPAAFRRRGVIELCDAMVAVSAARNAMIRAMSASDELIISEAGQRRNSQGAERG
jgi:hypothetical protein